MLIDVHTHHQHDWFCIQSIHAADYLNGSISNQPHSTGIHPWYADQISAEKFVNILANQASENLFAIGECGLDRIKGPDLQIQKTVFEQQLVLAQKLNLPVIVHQVKTLSDILPYIKKYQNNRYIMHGFRGNTQQMRQLLDYDVSFSFGKTALDPSDKLKNVISEVPLNRVFFETDEAACDIKRIYNNFAVLRQIDVQELELKVENNFTKVFKNSN
ncbi:MAG TPA: TatD family hydrolase [Salinivirga sp.]|uniref:TatD family hydrolase n=1 Tax=Salinivirga sp. TaxID=1970192 RepID=UPI002B45AA35|nr:TatD family hydrolase [Salinivirga sp.]HKK60037.1 TatD family hydrolase [Salinivirga sp.]